MKTKKFNINLLKTSLLFFTFNLIFLSCNEEWLEPKPLSFLTPENTFTNEEGMNSAINNCRSLFRKEFAQRDPNYLPDYYLTDLAIIRSGGIRDAEQQMLPSGAGETEQSWSSGFDGVNYANLVISRTPDIDEDENVKNQLIAEGYFHRAYWYYKLVHQFGDVPLILEETTSPKLDFYTSTRDRILKTMREDLEFAVQWLPENAPPGAVSRSAGKHLLTRYYMALGDFDAAITVATEIIEGSGHHLMTTRFGVDKNDASKNVYWDLFQKENFSLPENKEGILISQDKYLMDGGTGGSDLMRTFVPAWYNSAMKDPAGKSGTTDGLNGEPLISRTGRGIGKFKMSNYFSREVWDDPSDVRHLYPNWFPMDSIYYNNPKSKYYGQSVKQQYCTDTLRCWDPFMYCKVYVYEDDKPPGSGLNPTGGTTDWYIFRLAETYLLRAEAYVWKNNLAAAAADVNAIRARVNAAPLVPGQMSIETILDERARELFLEELRKSELTRISFLMAKLNLRGYSLENFSESNFWYDRIIEKNIYYRTNYIYGGFSYKMLPHNVLWPVPEDAISSNSQGRINQNYGYVGYEDNVTPKDE